jgi:hypothetical protein
LNRGIGDAQFIAERKKVRRSEDQKLRRREAEKIEVGEV